MSIYTFGYRGQRVRDIDWLTGRYDAKLIDIRMSATSSRPEWNGASLHATLGDRYIHIPEFGNRNYANGGPIEIADVDAGMEAINRWKLFAASGSASIILMCGCRELEGCHRRVVADEIMERWSIPSSELRFTWTKNAPSQCPVCRGTYWKGTTQATAVPDTPLQVGICGHVFIWRPSTVTKEVEHGQG
jgi:hypothetical protein